MKLISTVLDFLALNLIISNIGQRNLGLFDVGTYSSNILTCIHSQHKTKWMTFQNSFIDKSFVYKHNDH